MLGLGLTSKGNVDFATILLLLRKSQRQQQTAKLTLPVPTSSLYVHFIFGDIIFQLKIFDCKLSELVGFAHQRNLLVEACGVLRDDNNRNSVSATDNPA